jgi:hypothetical protein
MIAASMGQISSRIFSDLPGIAKPLGTSAHATLDFQMTSGDWPVGIMRAAKRAGQMHKRQARCMSEPSSAVPPAGARRLNLSEPRIAVYIDPFSHHFLGDKLFELNSEIQGDQVMAPYANLKAYFHAHGIPVRTADYFPAQPDGCRNLFFSLGRIEQYKRVEERQDAVLSAFFAVETPIIDPDLYRELNHAQHSFRRIFCWTDSATLEPWVGGPLRCLRFVLPQSFDKVHAGIWENTNRGFMVMVNANRLCRLKLPCRELYSERMRAVEYFGRTGEIDLYGQGWDGPTLRVGGRICIPGTFGKIPQPGTLQRINHKLLTYWQKLFPEPRLEAARKVYRGFTSTKAQTLGRYKFALCFENALLKGWITEKIFDCFFAGTVPVFWGATDVQDRIPSDCFIDMRRFADYGELRSYLRSLTPRDIQNYKEAARAFLESPRYRPFTKQAFAELFARIVEEDTGVKLAELGAARA